MGMADRRVTILEAATRMIAQAGVRGLRVERIAEAAGVSTALIYYHFTDRAGLLREPLAFIADRADRYTAPDPDSLDARSVLEQVLLRELQDTENVRENSTAWGELRSTAIFENYLRDPPRARAPPRPLHRRPAHRRPCPQPPRRLPRRPRRDRRTPNRPGRGPERTLAKRLHPSGPRPAHAPRLNPHRTIRRPLKHHFVCEFVFVWQGVALLPVMPRLGDGLPYKDEFHIQGARGGEVRGGSCGAGVAVRGRAWDVRLERGAPQHAGGVAVRAGLLPALLRGVGTAVRDDGGVAVTTPRN